MRRLALVIGLSAVVGVSAFACGDDVETTGTGGGNNNTGGEGGGTTVTTTTTTTPTTSTQDCTGPFDHICQEACCNVEVTCGFSGACQLAGSLLMVDLTTCTADEAQCVGQCLVDASCIQIASLAGSTPDPALISCLAPCTGECLGCVAENCGTQIQACSNDAACQPFIQCAAQCPEGDGACINQCAADNPSTATTELLDCAATSCNGDCNLGGGGGNGGGGNGGNGGGN